MESQIKPPVVFGSLIALRNSTDSTVLQIRYGRSKRGRSRRHSRRRRRCCSRRADQAVNARLEKVMVVKSVKRMVAERFVEAEVSDVVIKTLI